MNLMLTAHCDSTDAFYQSYYLGLLQDVFSVLTDTLHKPGFKLQALLSLARGLPLSGPQP